MESNPYSKILDIRDLLFTEITTPKLNRDEIKKDVENIMLRYNTDLKLWYKKYSRKVEREDIEESFSMTMRQCWRFLRDCQIPSVECSLAMFNRYFHQGQKNRFSIKNKPTTIAKQTNNLDWRPTTSAESKLDEKRIGSPLVFAKGR